MNLWNDLLYMNFQFSFSLDLSEDWQQTKKIKSSKNLHWASTNQQFRFISTTWTCIETKIIFPKTFFIGKYSQAHTCFSLCRLKKNRITTFSSSFRLFYFLKIVARFYVENSYSCNDSATFLDTHKIRFIFRMNSIVVLGENKKEI